MTHASAHFRNRRVLDRTPSPMFGAGAFRFAGRRVKPWRRNYVMEGLVYPEAPSKEHHDLATFLAYVSRTGKDTTSTVYVGTHYEYRVLATLERLGMSLKRIGGASDCGVDLLGTWTVPSMNQPLKVLVQCKAFAKSVRPAQARELEGAFASAPPGWRGPEVLGLLVSQKPATKGVLDALGKSGLPMGHVLCDMDGRLLQLVWNRSAEQAGLEGIGVELQYDGGNESEREIVLTWKGNVFHR